MPQPYRVEMRKCPNGFQLSSSISAVIDLRFRHVDHNSEIALRLVRPDGQVTKVGWSPETVATDLNPLVQRNVRLQGSFSHNYPIWERVIHLLDRGLTMPDAIVGLRSPLDGWREAFDAMHDGRVIKSVLVPGGG